MSSNLGPKPVSLWSGRAMCGSSHHPLPSRLVMTACLFSPPPPCSKRSRKGEKNGKGLRHFSMKVCEKVQRKGTTSYNEVADELVAEFSAADSHILPSESVSVPAARPSHMPVVALGSCGEAPAVPTLRSLQAYDQKNIRRRVYDALNVLMAMNIISKEKKEIKWIGLPTNSAQECQNLEVPWECQEGCLLGRCTRCLSPPHWPHRGPCTQQVTETL